MNIVGKEEGCTSDTSNVFCSIPYYMRGVERQGGIGARPHGYLDPGAGVQHDVLDGALDVLRPGHQPRHLVVVAQLLPTRPGGGLRVL